MKAAPEKRLDDAVLTEFPVGVELQDAFPRILGGGPVRIDLAAPTVCRGVLHAFLNDGGDRLGCRGIEVKSGAELVQQLFRDKSADALCGGRG